MRTILALVLLCSLAATCRAQSCPTCPQRSYALSTNRPLMAALDVRSPLRSYNRPLAVGAVRVAAAPVRATAKVVRGVGRVTRGTVRFFHERRPVRRFLRGTFRVATFGVFARARFRPCR